MDPVSPGTPSPGSPERGPASTRRLPDPEVDPKVNARYRWQTSARRWAKWFEDENREVFEHRESIVAALGLRPGLEVADIGTGTGVFTLEMAPILGTSGRLYAVDIHDYFLDHVEAAARKAGLSNVEMILATHDSSALPPNSIDLAFVCQVYHHIEQPGPYLLTLWNALRPGGRLVVIDFDRRMGDSFIQGHVRADPSVMREEIEMVGFVHRRTHDLLQESFFYEFERPALDRQP